MRETYKGYEIRIKQDNCGDSPRDWDNLGTMVCSHKRYNLGDKNTIDFDQFNGWDEVEEHLKTVLKAVVVLPLYLYDHGGITIRTTSFSDRWDSGQVGFIYVTKEAILANWMVKKLSKKVLTRAGKSLENEVKTYDQFLTGDVWGYVIEKGGEQIDSLWGMYGQDYCLQEAKSTIDHEIKTKALSHLAKVRAWVKNSVPLQARQPLTV